MSGSCTKYPLFHHRQLPAGEPSAAGLEPWQLYLAGPAGKPAGCGHHSHQLQDMTEFELPQKKLQRVQPENAKDGYLYFQLDTGDASANAPVLVIGLEKSRFFADAIPVHILLTIPEHGSASSSLAP